jgi:hypothetical protein
MDVAILVATIISMVFVAIPAAKELGFDVRIWGRSEVAENNAQMATNRPKIRLWLLLAVAVMGFVFAGSDLYLRIFDNQRNTPSTGIKIVSQTHFRPTDLKFGSGLRLTLATSVERAEAVQIFVICDGPIGLAPVIGESSKSGKFEVESQMLIASHSEVWNVKWRPEKWTTDEKLTFEFLSKVPIQVKWVFPIFYNPNANSNGP